jgi:hypothetical protein
MAQRTSGDHTSADATLALALKVAEGLEDLDCRIESLARVAIIQADWGERAAGRETLSRALQFKDIAQGGGRLIQQVISAARARVGDWDSARELALGMSDEALRAIHAERLSFEQTKAGEARHAVRWADTLSDPVVRANALLGVVRAIIEPK